MNKICGLSIILAFAMWSCKKNAGSPDNALVLADHVWYPYQTEVSIFDTMTVTPRGIGNPQPVTTIQHFDTVIVLEDCLRQSLFNFQKNGSLHISNVCMGLGYDSLWSVTQNVLLSTVSIKSVSVQNYYTEHLPILFTFINPDTTHSFILSRGNITEIDNAHFIFNNAAVNATLDFTTVSSDTVYKIAGKEFTTYRAQ